MSHTSSISSIPFISLFHYDGLHSYGGKGFHCPPRKHASSQGPSDSPPQKQLAAVAGCFQVWQCDWISLCYTFANYFLKGWTIYSFLYSIRTVCVCVCICAFGLMELRGLRNLLLKSKPTILVALKRSKEEKDYYESRIVFLYSSTLPYRLGHLI